MNDLRERLERLADAGVDGIDLTHPTSVSQRDQGPTLLTVAGVAAVVLVVVAMVVLGGRDEPGDDTAGGRGADAVTGADPGTTTAAPDALVAVVYGYPDGAPGDDGPQPGVVTDVPDMRIRFLDAAGNVLVERTWGEAIEQLGPGPDAGNVPRGIVQRLPAGELRLEATLPGAPQPVSCTQPFTVAEGDRLVVTTYVGVDAGPAADPVCAAAETVDQWMGDVPTPGPIGESYVGLTRAQAEAKADEAGFTTRIAADSGIRNALTADLVCDRIDLVLFADTVVAADLPQETMADDCSQVP
jgi:hypothetical protein